MPTIAWVVGCVTCGRTLIGTVITPFTALPPVSSVLSVLICTTAGLSWGDWKSLGSVTATV